MSEKPYDGPPLREGDILAMRFPGPAKLTVYEDIADEYAIVRAPDAACGLVVWAKYRGEWGCNPSSMRPVVKVLLEWLETAESIHTAVRESEAASRAAMLRLATKFLEDHANRMVNDGGPDIWRWPDWLPVEARPLLLHPEWPQESLKEELGPPRWMVARQLASWLTLASVFGNVVNDE